MLARLKLSGMTLLPNDLLKSVARGFIILFFILSKDGDIWHQSEGIKNFHFVYLYVCAWFKFVKFEEINSNVKLIVLCDKYINKILQVKSFREFAI